MIGRLLSLRFFILLLITDITLLKMNKI